MPREIRMLLAAGGTGGHLFPGVAVAEVARREWGAEVLFVGTQHGMEKEIIPALGVCFALYPGGTVTRPELARGAALALGSVPGGQCGVADRARIFP